MTPLGWARSRVWVLGSASPRRKAFLDRLGLRYRIVPHGLNEEELGRGVEPSSLADHLARAKLEAVASAVGDAEPILCADTVVLTGQEVLGQPKDRSEARRYLALLSGRKHRVITAVAVGLDGRRYFARSETSLRFAEMDAVLIEDYLDSGEWVGAAGGYRIQETGELLLDALCGSPSGVAGLPLRAFYGIIRAILADLKGSDTPATG